MKRSFYVRPSLLLLLALVASPTFGPQAGVVLAQRDAGEETSTTETAELVEDPDGDQQRGELPPPAEREKLQRRAGEKRLGGAQGSAVVLGMHIQEVDNARARVVDVVPATPAFDAGIRKGDEIVSFDGFHADTYRDWVDGMRRLVTDTPDGDSLPVVIDRGGKRLNLRLRVPTSNAGPSPVQNEVVLNQQVVPGQPPQPNVVVPGQPRMPLAGGGGDHILIADTFGENFHQGVTEAAIAELFRLNSSNAPPQPTTTADSIEARNAGQRNLTTRRGLATGTMGQRIGLAGFRDDANGLFVMVDVGGLEPGTYLVGIDDPGVLSTGPVNDNNPVPRNRGRTRQLDGRSQEVVQPPQVVEPHEATSMEGGAIGVPRNAPGPGAAPSPSPPTGPTAPSGSAPSGGQPTGATDGGQSQGRLESPRHKLLAVPRSVLAQVADPPTPASGPSRPPGANPTNTPANAPREPQLPASAGEESPGVIRPIGDPRTADARTNRSLSIDNLSGELPGTSGPVIRIGILTVDQSGTGRLQQTVEGVQVQGIVGQALVIYAMNAQSNRTLPPNLDATADPGVPTTDRRTPARGAATEGDVSRLSGTTNRGSRNVGAPANEFGGQTPVAGGLIRLISDTAAVPDAATGGAATTGATTDAQTQNVETPSVPTPQTVR